MRGGLIAPAQQDQQHAVFVVQRESICGLGVVQRTLEMEGGFVAAVHGGQQTRQRALGARRAGQATCGILKRGQRFSRPVQSQQRPAHIVVSLAPPGPQSDGALIGAHRLGERTDRLQRVPQGHLHVCGLRVGVGRFAGAGDGFAGPPAAQQRLAQIAQRLRIAGTDLERRLVGGDSLVEAAERHLRECEVVVGPRQIRIQANGLLVLLERVLESPHPLIGDAEGVMGLGVVRMEPDRRPRVFQAFGPAFLGPFQ